MKEKNVAGILALFLGPFGVHRFYLNQTGMGIFYLIFCWLPIMWIVGIIDAIAFFSMDQEDFDRKYNKVYDPSIRRNTDFDRRDYRRQREERRESRREERYHRQSRSGQRSRQYERPARTSYSRPRPKPPKANPYKQSGIKKYKDFDYDGAIEDFQRSLKIDPKDVATHFNLACAYSLNEETDKSFYHLDRAVHHGFTDFKRIKEHDALAYLRIQEGFDAFEENGFRQPQIVEAEKDEAAASNKVEEAPPEEDLLSQEPDLLDQLKRLGELRDKGLLTDAEFTTQKKKLLEE